MTNGRGAGMASFMTKKKKYKFQVEICLEELLEVPFVSAVLFAKLRLLDGGSFQDHSGRQEVRDHKVQWDSKFSFPCKMMANASTGVMERCVLRISIRKECKGGRSFNKLGFVDLNLAEYAGAGQTHKKALLEGYDARHRQDNSMLKFTIELGMLSGDILFKVPSPSSKQKQTTVDDAGNEQRSEEYSGGSLAGSIASGSSGFGSLPKKRPPLLSSDLVINQTLPESHPAAAAATDAASEAGHVAAPSEHADATPEVACEPGHSRNSSNTSQLSKASGYSSIHSHSHSRQSSSGDSGHIRDLHTRSVRTHNQSKKQNFFRTNTFPKKFNIPNTIPSLDDSLSPLTPDKIHTSTPVRNQVMNESNRSVYSTPKGFQTQNSLASNSSNDEYRTPDCASMNARSDIFSQNFNELQKSSSTSVVERIKNNMLIVEEIDYRKSDSAVKTTRNDGRIDVERERNTLNSLDGVLRSKSEFQIPLVPARQAEKCFTSKFFKSDSLFSFLTPRPSRRSTLGGSSPNGASAGLKVPRSPTFSKLKSLPQIRTTSLGSLRSGHSGCDGQQGQRNPSAGSLVISETGSLDRAKAAYERRKKTQVQEDLMTVPGRVEITRVNTDDLIEELLKNTNLEPTDDSAETSGLQLFIAKDGTAALGNHEVKSQMSTGAQVFKQVVMDDR